MKSITDRLLQSAACSRRFLEGGSRDRIVKFILSHQNPDGGFRGRGADSDLYYTVFALAGLKALGYPVPAFKVWRYMRSHGLGDDLDLVHLVCLIRLKAAFGMLGITRRRLYKRVRQHRAESAYGLFLTLLADDLPVRDAAPAEAASIQPDNPTTVLAASVLLSPDPEQAAVSALLSRSAEKGGFIPAERIKEPDLLSTATALFALTDIGIALDDLQRACFGYVESLWRDSGGFAGHEADEFEDVEYTFYALLAIGCLIQSMAKDYGR